MLAWTKHGDVVNFSLHWSMTNLGNIEIYFSNLNGLLARSLTTANQWKIERKNGRQTIAFFNKIHDISWVKRDIDGNAFRDVYTKMFRQLNIRILCFYKKRKTVASWSCSGFSHHIFDHEIRRKFRLEYSLFLLFTSRTPSFPPCTTMRAFY